MIIIHSIRISQPRSGGGNEDQKEKQKIYAQNAGPKTWTTSVATQMKTIQNLVFFVIFSSFQKKLFVEGFYLPVPRYEWRQRRDGHTHTHIVTQMGGTDMGTNCTQHQL